MSLTAKQIQFLQVKRRMLGISDEEYAAMKASVGASSTKNLTVAQMNQLLVRMGHEPAGFWKRMHRSAKKSGMHRRPPADKEGMVRKVEAILAELKLPWGYVDGMARKMFGVDAFRFCDAEQTYKVLQALAVFQRRHGGPRR